MFLAATLGLSAPAHAMSCTEVVNMVRVKVPTEVVLATVLSSRPDAEAVECLQRKRGMPAPLRELLPLLRVCAIADEEAVTIEECAELEPPEVDMDEILRRYRAP